MTDLTETQFKSVHIEGDKSFFISKGAIDRFKRDIKNDDTTKLSTEVYFKEDWTYQILSKSDLEIKVKIVNKIDLESGGKPRVLHADEKRQILKDKLRKMRNSNLSQANFKSKFKDTVPKDLLDEYLQLKKHKLPIDLLDPSVVLANPDEYKNVIHTMVQSFGMYKGNNNPVINYYKSLAKHLDIPTTFVGNTNVQKKVEESKSKVEESQTRSKITNNFVEQLQMERQILVENDVDEEMKKIYESLGISIDELNK